MTKFPFLSSSSDPSQDSRPPVQSLSFHVLPTETGKTLISRVEPSGATFPLFSYTSSKKSLQLTRIGVGSSILQPTPVGDAEFHTFSDTDLIIMGKPLVMKERDSIGGYKLDHPQFGKLKWHDNRENEAYVLEDAGGTRIARYRPGVGKSVIGGFLDIYVPVDDSFLDLLVLFTIAMIAESDDFEEELEETNNVFSNLGGGGS